MIDPWINPEAYLKFRIGDRKSPGIVVAVDGFDSEWEWDEKKGKGTKKANITHTGQKLAEGSFTIELWSPGHGEDWADFYNLCSYNTDKAPAQALKLYYPTVSVLGVLAVVTTKITPIIHAGKGKYQSTFSFKEWVPAPKKNATNTPTGAGNGGKGSNVAMGTYDPSDPIADQKQRQIQALLDQANKP